MLSRTTRLAHWIRMVATSLMLAGLESMLKCVWMVFEKAVHNSKIFDDDVLLWQIVAEDEYEKALLMAVIPPNEVGVKFDHIGALENVKNALKELVMLPLQRPELFAKGNLTRVCSFNCQ